MLKGRDVPVSGRDAGREHWESKDSEKRTIDAS